MSTKYSKSAAFAATLAAAALFLSACAGTTETDEPAEGGEALSGAVVIDGSSTVAPNTEVAAELFQEVQPDVQVSVGVSGTGGGFEKFCNGETDISEASRRIADDEIAACEANGIEFVELGVANDGLAVVVNPENDFVDCLTVDEISSMWRPEAPVTNWADVRAGFPDLEITLYGPGTDSGTFDFFTDEINGDSGAINPAYNDIGEDDNAAVLGVAGAPGNSAFIPLSFVEAAGDQVRAIAIENEAGECVEPSLDTVLTGEYNPLGRQLFVYPSAEALTKPQVLAFLEFYITNQATIAETAGFIPLNDDQEAEALAALQSLVGYGLARV
ncbi:phosphate ABC transporter substrate-binding protein PstS family protein [Microcella sp.]|uniref:phosphate ABC transporter substrate-binding protein PstS family protein n=1 Tax=Microcella sp. TaxID=1913979 RepID=UPI00255F3BBC|nr:phosphate ABC transporter substrate-binding protein PstS family protein [Microcella sp.]MBX9472569.1 phosphate ABC transporter substrate-binding protein PstS family protein [Microcella sp.]